MGQQPVLKDGSGVRWVTAEYAGELLRRAEEAEKRLEEADLRNMLLLGRGNGVAEELDEAEARVQILEKALRVAADELSHASRTLIANGSIQNGYWAEDAAKNIRAALASEGTPEEVSP